MRLRRLWVVSFVALGSIVAVDRESDANLLDPPPQVYVQSISYGGTGCPQGSVGNSFSDDRQEFTLIFDQFVATSGPGVLATENRKNCQLNINLRLPSGFTIAALHATYFGYVQLPAGVTAERSSIYYTQGEAQPFEHTRSFQGPISEDYEDLDVVSDGFLVDAPCGQVIPINVNSQVRLLGALGQPAQITNDSIDGVVSGITLTLKKC